MAALETARTMARSLSLTPSEGARNGLALRRDGQRRSAFKILSYPEIGIADLTRIWPAFGELDAMTAAQLEIDAKYHVYLSRQAADVESYRRDESVVLGEDIDYQTLPGLSNEVRHKLQLHRPRTIGQAARIDGVTPAALTLLVAYLRRARGGLARKPASGAA
jgi:tRNA uridine 5-carboxymethylaminomethyl modification enzyme